MASKKPLRTIDVKPTDGEMVKPGELIEFKEMVPLSLADRRIFNTLVRNAWDSIDEPKEHSIRKVELRGSHNVNDRIGDSIERLMTVIVRHPITRNDGKLYIRRFHLLDTNDEAATDDNGLLHYSFPAALRALIKQSTHYALLKKEVMYAFGSKYALALYELIAKRINLKHKTNEAIPLDRFRALLGVEPDKLREFKNLKSRAIDPSVLEVNALCGDFSCAVEPVYQGRKVTAVKLSWREKTAEERKAAWRELNGSKIGRNARLTGTVEQADTLPELPTPEKPKQTAADDRLKKYAKATGVHVSRFLDEARAKLKG